MSFAPTIHSSSVGQELSLRSHSFKLIASAVAQRHGELLLVQQRVLPLDMVENSINLCKPISGWFIRHWTDRTGLLFLA